MKPKAPPELLEEMFEIQEVLQEAKAGGLGIPERDALTTRREQLRARYRDEEARLTGPLGEAWDAATLADRSRLLGGFKDGLGTLAYLRTVIEDLGAVLDGDQETHVTHRRH